MKASPRPVVVVPEEIETNDSVLVAYDGSIAAARTLQFLVSNELHSLGDIHVLSVDSDSQDKTDANTRRAQDFLSLHGVDCQTLAVVSDKDIGQIMVKRLRGSVWN